ncbi:hypothetical protein [Nonomuraea aurantiaca]|uniref:hypothetical protein n=1 Tax=Nonomuraea aurantiaca TaxID=2878562 RepID=UPI001CD94B6C|nr:hypothetical protein [Nonomuraea aurantiaca]MCA2226102.1 hypothetical protein [Nonomuraea aurantiaca]
MLAFLVARRVAPDKGRGVGFEQESTKCFDRNIFLRISARDFARRTGTSAKRVMAFFDAWERLADEGVVDHAADLHPDTEVELPDSRKYPFYGSKGYYRSWEAASLKSDRVEAIEEEAEKSGTRPSAVAYILNHPTAIKTALLTDEPTRTAAWEALEEFDARQAAADADRAAAAEVTSERQREYDDVIRAERDAYAAQAREAGEGSQADASMDVFNAMAEIRMAASRALALLSKQEINFTTDRAEAIAELCDGAEAAIAAVRDMATGAALDDAALAAFMDENGKFL